MSGRSGHCLFPGSGWCGRSKKAEIPRHLVRNLGGEIFRHLRGQMVSRHLPKISTNFCRRNIGLQVPFAEGWARWLAASCRLG
jgi:hypothetical protein